MALFEEINVEIFSSRDEIRNQLVDEAKLYLELESVDLYKTSFVSYIINVLSILSANQMFYSSTVYREFFLLQAQIQESVYNLAKWIGYTIPQAEPATVDVLFTMDMGFTDSLVNFTIPNDYKVYAGDLEFTIDSTITINANIKSTTTDDLSDLIFDMVDRGVLIDVINNNIVSVRNANGFHFPVQITIDEQGENPVARFILPFTQVSREYTSFKIPDNLEFYQFYNKRVSNLNGLISDTQLYVIDPDIDMTNVNSIDEFEAKFNESEKSDYLWDQSTTGMYTLTSSDTEYQLTVFDDEADILFGNGIIGFQPQRGSTVSMIMAITKGEDGNVVPGAITTGDPIYYTTDAGRALRIKFSVTNLSIAANGKNAPALSEVKKNAISNLSSKNRLVSGPDYTDFNTIVPDVPLSGTIPILKRSDIKVNEITLFSQLIYDNPDNPAGQSEIVPTRNIAFPIDSTSSDFFISRGSSPIGDDSDFETVFNMEIDIDSSQANYEYLIQEVDITSSLESTDPTYNSKVFFTLPTVTFSSNIDSTNSEITNISILANSNHTPGTDVTQFRCVMETEFDNQTYNMITELDITDPTKVNGFSYEFFNFLNFPKGVVTFKFEVYALIPYNLITNDDKLSLGINGDPLQPSQWMPISVWTTDVIIRQNLSEFMISSVTSDNDGNYIVHNVPAILSQYLTDLETNSNRNDFELNVLQTLISEIKINSKKMLTDFINIKFPDTHGSLSNMLYNPIADDKIISRSLERVPGEYDHITIDDISSKNDLTSLTDGYIPVVGDRILSTLDNSIYIVKESGTTWEFSPRPIISDIYIVNGGEGIDFLGVNWADHKNEIVQWTGSKWVFITPTFDEFIEIDNIYNSDDPDQGVRLQWSGSQWVIPVFEIPFVVSLKINKDSNVPITSFGLTANIRTALIDHFSPKFGMDQNIDRSEILKVVRSVDGVQYAEVLKPEVDIRFKYDINDLEFEDLLDYTPQLVAFIEDGISITIVNN